MIAIEPLASPPLPMMRASRFQPVRAWADACRVRRWCGAVVGSVLVVLLLIQAIPERSQHYDTYVPVPTGRETYAEVTPVTVAGIEREFEALPGRNGGIRGTRIRYGDAARIDIARLPSQALLDRYVIDEVEPRLVRYERRTSDHGAGGWRIEGSDAAGGRLYGWQNQNWLFVIEAVSQTAFDEVVDQFTYIRRR